MPKPSSFTYADHSGNEFTYDLHAFKKFRSTDSLGVWVIWGSAWKIFSHIALWERVCSEYQIARDRALVDSRTYWTQVNVRYDDNTWTQGFAIVSPFVDVGRTTYRSFNLKCGGGGSVKSIIKRINNIEALQRIERALREAEAVMLRHPQGFIDTNPNSSMPVVFIDIHLHNKPADKITDIRRFVEKRIQDKWQQQGRRRN